MTAAERLMVAYGAAWERRQASGDVAPDLLAAEIEWALVESEARDDDEVADLVVLLEKAWRRGTAPHKLWRPLLWGAVRSLAAVVPMTVRLLRTPKEFKLPHGRVPVSGARVDHDEEEFEVMVALPFVVEDTTDATLAWCWPIAHGPDDSADEADVPVWLDVAEGSGTAVVMVGGRRVGTTTVPGGTYDALRRLDRRKRRCVPDGDLDLRRTPDGIVVVQLCVELP